LEEGPSDEHNRPEVRGDRDRREKGGFPEGDSLWKEDKKFERKLRKKSSFGADGVSDGGQRLRERLLRRN